VDLRKKIKKAEITVSHRFTAFCAHCGAKWESNSLKDMPEDCEKCKMGIIVNDSKYLFSRRKAELIEIYEKKGLI